MFSILKVVSFTGFEIHIFLLSGKHSVIWITLANWHNYGHYSAAGVEDHSLAFVMFGRVYPL